MNLDKALYPRSVAAQVCGWPPKTMHTYFQRGILEYHEGDAPAGKMGETALLSLRSVLRLAIAKKLNDVGVPLRSAFLTAMYFTDFSTEKGRNSYDATRGPCELFDNENFLTLLAHFPDGNPRVVAWPREGRVKIHDIDALIDELIFSSSRSPSTGSAFVLVNDVVRDVLAALNVTSK